MEMTLIQKIERVQGLQQSIERCTQPVDGHTDPLSINDCWNWMRELLSEIKDESEQLTAIKTAVSGALPNSQHWLLKEGMDDLILNDRNNMKPQDRVYASDAIKRYTETVLLNEMNEKKDFLNWAMHHFVDCHGGYMPRFQSQIKANVYTYEQLLEKYNHEKAHSH